MSRSAPHLEQINPQTESRPPAFSWKLWLYTNYDCNLRCRYCVAESSPEAPRRALGLENVKRLVDEAVVLGFQDVFLTGGEPFILDDIYEMLAYASASVRTTVLSNGMLFRGRRLERLRAIANDNLIVQISLDGGRAEDHDAYRGAGTWAKTVEGIKRLQRHDVQIRLSSTETPANSAHLEKLHAFRRDELNIPDEHHFVRPLAKRGFSDEGQAVSSETLVPEVTVTIDGVFWHPLASPSSLDMRVSDQIFPLAAAVDTIREQVSALTGSDGDSRQTFT